MKSSKQNIHTKIHKIPTLRFCEDKKLTSYSGLIIFQALFQLLQLKTALRSCFLHLKAGKIFGHATVFLMLIVHVILGFRRLRTLDYYKDDPLVARVIGIRSMPDVATVSRTLASFDSHSVDNVRNYIRQSVTARVVTEQLKVLTVDFDGSVQSTSGHAEGTAVGFNKKHKGQRSYYALFATVAQTGQFFDMHHRPGNVHDSNGAVDFIAHTLYNLQKEMPKTQLECRIDSAFYNQTILHLLQELNTLFTCSVPFERFPKLKKIIENRKRWRRISGDQSYFESDWTPDCWNRRHRLLIVRTRRNKQVKGPLQLDLFSPRDRQYEYKVIATNRIEAAEDVILFHDGRGSQEKLFGEAKQHAALALIPTKRVVGNQIFTLAGMLAHNLGRELQMNARPAQRKQNSKRTALWKFESLGTIRQHLIHKAGTLTRPQGELTLTMNANDAVSRELENYLHKITKATA